MFRVALNVAGRSVVRQSAPRSHKMFDRLAVQSLTRSCTTGGMGGSPPSPNDQGSAAVYLVTAIGGLMAWGGYEDEAPYTERKRFMIVDRDSRLLKMFGSIRWTWVKRKYREITLPKTHPTTLAVERIGARIAQASGLEAYKWEIIVVKNGAVKAFALPGGKIVVSTGLLDATPNSASLASVLGHEMGHIIANHDGEKISKNFLKEGMLLCLSTFAAFEDPRVSVC